MYLCTYPFDIERFERSPRKLNVNMDRVDVAMTELFIDAHDMYRDSDGFHWIIKDIGTSESLEKHRPFRFLVEDKIGIQTRQKYACHDRITILVDFVL